MLALNRPRTTQPAGWGGTNAKLGRFHTLFSGSAPAIDSAGTSQLLTSALEFSGRPGGTGVAASTVSGYISDARSISGDRTVVIYCRPVAASGTKVIFTSAGYSVAGAAYWVGTSGNAWSIGGSISAGANTVVVEKDQIIVATKRGTTHSIYVDGILKASATTSLADGVGTTWLRLGNNTGYTWTTAQGRLYAGAVLTRALSAAEVSALTLYPWSLFEQQRIFIPVAAGGAGSQSLTPGLFTNDSTFYAPTVTAGAVSLTAALFSNSHSFYAATVTQGAQALSPGLLSNASTFYAPSVSAGAVTLAAALFTNASTFYAASVTSDGQFLEPGLFSNSPSFYALAVTVGGVTVAPALFSNANTFYSAVLTGGVEPTAVRRVYKLDEQPQLGNDPNRMRIVLTEHIRNHAREINRLKAGFFSPKLNTATAAPTTGTWAVGDFIANEAPAELGTASSKYFVDGWTCLVAGTPGTWVQRRILTGN